MSLKHVVILRAGPQWQAGQPLRSQRFHVEHLAHWGKWLNKGLLLEGGHFMDHSGGLMILAEGVTEEDAMEFASKDPAVKNGVLIAYVKPWYQTVTSLVAAPTARPRDPDRF